MPRRVVIPLAAAVLAVCGVAAWFLTHRADPRPASYSGEPTSAMYAVIDSRQRDAAPLSLGELFTAPTVGGLRKLTSEQFTDCSEALWGIDTPGCTQALRATFASDQVAGEFVIFNLPDGHAADTLVAALSHSGFVRQATPFDASHSRAQARALGHYVTVTWVGPTQAATPDLLQPLVALDTLGHAIQPRVIAAT